MSSNRHNRGQNFPRGGTCPQKWHFQGRKPLKKEKCPQNATIQGQNLREGGICPQNGHFQGQNPLSEKKFALVNYLCINLQRECGAGMPCTKQ